MGAVRLFLALVVAVDHFRAAILRPAGLGLDGIYELGVNGGIAVMFFFMISGFLISMVLSRKYPAGLSGTLGFYQARFIRIFSLYWPLAFIILIVSGAARHALLSSGYDAFTNLFVFGIDWRVAFASYPDLHWSASLPMFLQTWTLGPELTFYVLAPWLLRSPRLTLVVLVLSAATRVALVHQFGFDVRWTYIFLPSTFLFFLLGHLAQTLSWRFAWLRRGGTGGALLVACIACLTVGSYAVFDSVRFWVAVLCLAAALPGLFHATSEWRFFNLLGALSYPLYLTHTFLIDWLAQWNEQISRHSIGHIGLASAILATSFLVACVLVALATHWLVERPVAAMMRSVADAARSLRPARGET
jgi:peptidoglycan/LPS O-acetylase OafA/YrhL